LQKLSLETALKTFVCEKIAQTKILVWYDEGATLAHVIERVIPSSTELIVFRGSYLQIREKIEKDGNLSKCRVIYIPQPPLKKSWLKDYELFGERIELDLPTLLRDTFHLNSTLESNNLLTPQNCRRLALKWNHILGEIEPPITLEQLEEASISALLDQTSRFDLKKTIMQFLEYPDETLQKLEKSGLSNFLLKILKRNGLLAIEVLDPKRIAASILLSELLLSSENIEATPYQNILPDLKTRSYWAEIVHDWAQNASSLDSFFGWSRITETDYDIKDAIKGHSGIEKSEAFQIVDQVLLEEVQSRIQDNAIEGLIKNARYIEHLSNERLTKIWSREGKTKEWSTLSKIISLLDKIEHSLQALDNKAIIGNYFDDLWIVDQLFREISSHINELWGSLSPSIEDSVKEKYQQWLQKTNVALAENLEETRKWPIQQYKSQVTFWKDYIKPKEKLCLFVLDALRYELQKRLMTYLESINHKAKLTPMLSSLPSITEVGMTALLPNSKLDINISKEKIQVLADGEIIENKKDRLEWIKKKYTGRVATVDMSNLRKDNKNVTGHLGEVDLLIVSDLDIDKAGGNVSNDLLEYFDKLLGRIINAIDVVTTLGFNKVIIATDHGFLSIPKPESVKVIEDFSEKGVFATRRFAIGKPQTNEDAIILPLKNLGYSSREDILLPKGISYLPRQGPRENYIHGGLSLQECCIGVIEVETKTKKKRVSVIAEAPEPISSKIFRIKLIPKSEELFPIHRMVKASLYFHGDKIGESEQIEVSNQARDLIMKLSKTKGVGTVELKIEDVITKETVFRKEIRVSLEGYEDLF
jgi:hypothetical protein